MVSELAEHISLLAAPIFAALLGPVLSIDGAHVPKDILDAMRKQAIVQALKLWQETLETETNTQPEAGC